jgi:hypothetical protein
VQLSLLRAVARSGFFRLYYPVLVAGTKAKSVTNNLPILSVLAEGLFLKYGLKVRFKIDDHQMYF